MSLGAESRGSRSLAACKIEATYNQDPSLTPATDAFLTYESAETYKLLVEMSNEQAHSPSRTNRQKTAGKNRVQRNVKFWWQGGTGAGVADKSSPLIQCCGVKEVIVASTSVTHTPAKTTEDLSAKLGVEHDGWIYATPGLFGNFIMRGTVNGSITVDFEGKGLRQAPTNAAYTTWAGGVKRAKPFLNLGLALVGGAKNWSPVVNAFEFNRGVNIEELDDGNSSSGIAKTYIDNAAPSLTLTLAADRTPGAQMTLADIETQWLAQTTHALTLTLSGAAGNTCAMSYPQLQIEDVDHPVIRGAKHVRVKYWVQHSTDENEFSWVWT